MILMAQAVPEATSVPCLATLPAGWDLGGVEVEDGDRDGSGSTPTSAGDRAVEATLLRATSAESRARARCRATRPGSGATSGSEQLPPDLRSTRYYLFPGGCVTYEFAFDGRASASLIFDADSALAFQPARRLVAAVREQSDLRLCGAGRPVLRRVVMSG